MLVSIIILACVVYLSFIWFTQFSKMEARHSEEIRTKGIKLEMFVKFIKYVAPFAFLEFTNVVDKIQEGFPWLN